MDAKTTRDFFRMVQNKLHYAVHRLHIEFTKPLHNL